jgi:uncharacterized lipoprotein YajG
VRKRFVLVVATLVLAGCGSGSSAVDYTEFCGLAQKMNAVSGTHGEDPAAITDPQVMADTWAKVTAAAKELRDNAPKAVKDDVTLMVSTILDMDAIFQKNKYDLVAMSKDEKVRAELAKISADESVGTASTRFNKYMAANCAK